MVIFPFFILFVNILKGDEYSNHELMVSVFRLVHSLLAGDSLAAASVFSRLLPDNLPDKKFCGLPINVTLSKLLKPCAWTALIQWDLLKTPTQRFHRLEEIIEIIMEMDENRTKVSLL